jgi:hypothetical protein
MSIVTVFGVRPLGRCEVAGEPTEQLPGVVVCACKKMFLLRRDRRVALRIAVPKSTKVQAKGS